MLSIKNKNVLLSYFILCYALSDLAVLVINQIVFDETDFFYDFVFYIGNILCILAYIFLLIKICKSLNFKYIFKHFKMHLLVLSALNIFLIYVIQNVVIPSAVFKFEYYFELFYNLLTFTLLSLSLLNYFYKDNKKALYIFLGTLCIVFSEMMDIAYFYISAKNILFFVSTTLTIIAFYFFYTQEKFLNKLPEEKRLNVL